MREVLTEIFKTNQNGARKGLIHNLTISARDVAQRMPNEQAIRQSIGVNELIHSLSGGGIWPAERLEQQIAILIEKADIHSVKEILESAAQQTLKTITKWE